MTIGVAIALAVACLLLQALFSGSEVALSSANRGKLEEQATAGDAGSAAALGLLQDDARLFGTCLLGATTSLVTGTVLVALALGSAGVAAPWAPAVAYGGVALVLGEALPRRVNLHHATRLAPWAARFVRASQWPMLPLLPLVRGWAALLARLTGANERTVLTRQEILQILEQQRPVNAETHDEHEMIRRVFAITETAVEDCMTPLVRVDALPEDASVREAAEVVLKGGHTRLPVYRDRVDHIVGVVHARDLLFGTKDDAKLSEIVRPVKYVPDSKHVDELLNEMRRAREPFAVVVDEYGGSVGIVTIEDLLEEIIGDIRDERDAEDAGIRKLAEQQWRVAARVEVDDLEDALGRPLPEGDYETVAGLVLASVGRIPRKGEIVVIDGLRFYVEDANERAVVSFIVSIPPLEPVVGRTRSEPRR